MKKIVFVGIFLSCISGYSQTKKEKIAELVQLSGIGFQKMGLKGRFIQEFKNRYPSVTEAFWKGIEQKIDINELINKTGILFEKYYSEEEIDELLKFYKSPLGKKMIENMPQIMKEGEEAGRNWAQKTVDQINNELTKEGYLQSPPPPGK